MEIDNEVLVDYIRLVDEKLVRLLEVKGDKDVLYHYMCEVQPYLYKLAKAMRELKK